MEKSNLPVLVVINPYPDFLHFITAPLCYSDYPIPSEHTSQNWFSGFATIVSRNSLSSPWHKPQPLLSHLAARPSWCWSNLPQLRCDPSHRHGIPLSPGVGQPVSSRGIATRVPVSAVLSDKPHGVNFFLGTTNKLQTYI